MERQNNIEGHSWCFSSSNIAAKLAAQLRTKLQILYLFTKFLTWPYWWFSSTLKRQTLTCIGQRPFSRWLWPWLSMKLHKRQRKKLKTIQIVGQLKPDWCYLKLSSTWTKKKKKRAKNFYQQRCEFVCFIGIKVISSVAS